MTRRRILFVGTLLGLAAAAAVLSPGVRWRLWGLWRGEAFYQGRPTSYWRGQILHYPNNMAGYGRRRHGAEPGHYYATASPVDELKRVCGVSCDIRQVPFPFAERSPAALPVLIELLRDRDPVLRRYAADCLGDLGPKARAAVPALLRALRDQEKGGFFCTVSEAAADALKQIDPETAAQAGVPRDGPPPPAHSRP
jgi:hypothetical protein